MENILTKHSLSTQKWKLLKVQEDYNFSFWNSGWHLIGK